MSNSEDAQGASMKFKVGDRVAYYDINSRITGVVVVCTDDNVKILYPTEGCDAELSAHPKQCRRLKPKVPLRRLYFSEAQLGTLLRTGAAGPSHLGIVANIGSAPTKVEIVEFVEVRRKK